MAMARLSGSAVPALLVALLVCAAGKVTVVVGGTACDGVSCGMGSCKEVPALIPFPKNTTYECDCDPGWSRPPLVDLLSYMPCTVPTCPDHSCFNLTPKPPVNINNITDPCQVMYCGLEGTCIKEVGFFNFTCECKPGAANALNVTSFPCIENCVIGKDGCPVLSPPQSPPPSTSPAPPGNHDSSGPTAPSSTKGNATSLGSVSSQNLLQLLLLASLAAVQIV